MEAFKQPDLNLGTNTGIHLDGPSIAFKTDHGTCMILTNNGLLGIGTENPQSALDVRGPVRSDYGVCASISFFGNTAIGNMSHTADAFTWAGIGNKDLSGTINQFALLQSQTGHTILNAKSGQDISMSINNFAKMKVNSIGQVLINYSTTQHGDFHLQINGKILTSSSANSFSDDRIKYNEENITNNDGLSIIKQLQPQKYEKIMEIPQDISGTWMPTDAEWPNVKDNYVWGLEAGLIAQDIQTIPGLSFAVSGQEVNSEGTQAPLGLNYNDIYAYHIAATKELSSQLDTEKAKTTNLETQMESANSKIAVLETQVADLIARVSALESA